MYKRVCLVAAFLFITEMQGRAQGHEQLWLDYQLDYPFANVFLFEFSATYSTVLTQEFKWRSLSVSPTFEYTLSRSIDLTAEVPIGYTLQEEGTNSFEISPILGARFHITQNRRINTRILLRYQQRYFREIEKKDWDISNRTRIKAEAYVCINQPNLFTDNLWYGIVDYEEFIVLDDQVAERYANRRRARIGLGYRMNYKHRFELIYTWQSSRNEIEGDFISDDKVIQLRYKMYLNPAKPVQPGQ
jgi:hypothetical protein